MMNQSFYLGNRRRLYAQVPAGSALVFFSGEDVCKTNDEAYPFFADRSFLYLTGIAQKQSVLMAVKETDTAVRETLYILPPDLMAERWTGRRLKPQEAEAVSGVRDIRHTDAFSMDLHRLLSLGGVQRLYLDLYKANPADRDRPAQMLCRQAAERYPFVRVENGNALVRKLRLYKQPCEIAALRQAEKITGEGILAMMRASKPGMFEYQYKAAFDHALGQYGPQMQGFPPIISAGRNNFCIHYYEYTGQAQDGDMVLNDVGAQWKGLITDVSRGWPCNGRYTEKQKLLFDCALETSNYMFSIIRPGMKMSDVDATVRAYNAQLLVDRGVLKSADEVGKLMWHGGAHHIGFDVHDVVATPEIIGPNMAFCVDVGIYHEEWGIGFRLEDNCLVTETGCENLSAAIPRTTEDIEAVMAHR